MAPATVNRPLGSEQQLGRIAIGCSSAEQVRSNVKILGSSIQNPFWY